ncbi:MAG TPA: type I DNA topoisomerase, partial [Patescibacteria group bacterium]|nr:type I DNA topoisomerase [Patescibacteria group bacterium]
EEAIKEALQNPRGVDLKLVNAQQARRILDRLVGYELSPFLWKKVAKGLSAGRVQSVAVRLVVEREREIESFRPEEYWSIIGEFTEKKQKQNFEAKLNKKNGKAIGKMGIKTEKETNDILKEIKDANYAISKVERKESRKNPPAPFTTSTLQQTANRWFGFSAKQTMVTAQQLYEGVNTKGKGQIGLITYMRTDSLNLSGKFLSEAQKYLQEKVGKNYSLDKPRFFKTKSKGAQEAHEAIRPTSAFRDPESLKNSLNNNQYRLYSLIWQRALASQMPAAVLDTTTIDIEAQKTPYEFRSNGQILKFKGYLEIYPEKSKELELPEVKQGDEVDLKNMEPEQHFTKPPGRYSDAGLVKELEKHGIGRPSTYAPTISTIIARNYVNRDDNKKLAPTDIAFVVNDLLVKHFPRIVDFKFTAEIENDL